MVKKYVNHIFIGIISLFILVSTLFIKNPSDIPERTVKLGYPVHFVVLDFSEDQRTSMSGAPDNYLAVTKFNIMSSWEEHIDIIWLNAFMSCGFIFILLESVSFVISKLVKLSK